MPISADTWNIQGYTWAPKFSILAERALQKAGFDRQRFAAALTVDSIGQGLSPENEVLLVWAGQQATDKRISLRIVERRKDAMGPEGWGLLVRWFAAVYGAWTVARATARVSLQLSPSKREEERV